MKLYNALSQNIELFKPQNNVVTIYVCGITPYDTTHLGHAFTYTTFDVLIRYLELKGYEVKYVQNVTDIDDDILRKSNEVDDEWLALGNRWTTYFIKDLRTLNVRPPDHFPRATDVISDMIDIVQRLIKADVAYEAGGSVYFHIDAWPEYGKLSRIPREKMLPIANDRGNKPDDPHKRDPLDFVLWQAQAPGEPAWDSPWGPGRPGWHIECSTMAASLLGNTIDVHGGGGDLMFPHHESEIAQSEAATGKKPFVRFWLHTAMVYHEGEKMSKSLGNLIMARDLLKEWSPDTVRLYLANRHYRQVWSHNYEELVQAKERAEKLQEAVRVPSGDGPPLDLAQSKADFMDAMDLDLNAPTALTILKQMAERVMQAGQDRQDVREAQAVIREFGQVFGLRLDADQPEDRVITGWNEHLERFKEQ